MCKKSRLTKLTYGYYSLTYGYYFLTYGYYFVTYGYYFLICNSRRQVRYSAFNSFQKQNSGNNQAKQFAKHPHGLKLVRNMRLYLQARNVIILDKPHTRRSRFW